MQWIVRCIGAVGYGVIIAPEALGGRGDRRRDLSQINIFTALVVSAVLSNIYAANILAGASSFYLFR